METYFHRRDWQEAPAPTAAACCPTLVNASHFSRASSPTFYVEALEFLLHSSKPNHFRATGTYRVVNLGPRSTAPTARSLGPGKQTARLWGLTPRNSPYRRTVGLVPHLADPGGE